MLFRSIQMLDSIDRLAANVSSHKISDWQHNQSTCCCTHDPFQCPTQALANLQKNEIAWVVTALGLIAK